MAFILENIFCQNNLFLGSFHLIFLLGAEVQFYLIFLITTKHIYSAYFRSFKIAHSLIFQSGHSQAIL